MQRKFERIGTRSEWRNAAYSWLLVAGRAGWRQLFAGRFPLFVVMPQLGGAATADKLLVRFPELRVIFTSGYSRGRDERTANLSQPSYLQEPYSPTRLGRLVRDILDGERSLRVRDMVRVGIAVSRRIAADATLKRASAPGT